MVKELKTVDDRLEWLTEELLLAKEEIAGLSCRLEAIERGRVVASFESPLPLGKPHPESEAEQEEESALLNIDDDSWAHLGQAVLLPRVAAVSFMLVVALILRTVTDNGMIGQLPGSLLGMTYSIGLIAAGFVLYSRKSPLAPVFPACGALLLYAIIFETQSHFAAFSGQTGYLLLLAADIAIVIVGLHCYSKTLLGITVFASTLVGIAIGFPSPRFDLLGLIVLTNGIAAHFASKRRITDALRWWGLLFAILLWMLWAYKLNFSMKFSPKQLEGLGREVSLPMLFVFWGFYTYTSLWQTLKSEMPVGVFHHLLPSVVAGGTFFVAHAVLAPWLGRQDLIGLAAVLMSALYLAVVAWLARLRTDDIPGGKEFVTAATILLVQGLSVAVLPLWALPIWTVAAAILTLRADSWRSGGIRLISYLFQIFVLVFALRHGSLTVGEAAWPLGASVAALMAFCNIWLYCWCRRHPPDAYDSAFFTVFDRGDYSAVSLLALGLFYGFAAMRFLASVLFAGEGAEVARAFACAQSVILNAGIVLLLIVGLRKRNRELLVVAGVVVLVAAVKVFLFDLLRASGLPLVASVFSFGVVAAASSVVLRKWQRGSVGRES